MPQQIEVKIQIIIHGTDDSEKIKNSVENVFNLDSNDFKIQNLTGHFENPITMLTLLIKKKIAKEFTSKLFSKMKKNDLKIISENLDKQLPNTNLKIRISKQELIMGKIVLDNKDAIKITITIPIYVKKDFTQTYRQTLKIPE
tara:strand:- start:522 stop:950 length:429 start_codon:yes stop_codon:yes gene_type:complete